jgi:hypothetical protein
MIVTVTSQNSQLQMASCMNWRLGSWELGLGLGLGL